MNNFNSNNPEHIALFNQLCNIAAKHFATAEGSVYYSDVIRDVETLSDTVAGEVRYWLIGKTATSLTNSRETAHDLFHNCYVNQALYTVEHCVSKYGTHSFSVVLTD